ncbi:MAG: single-stranded DNA-binding protein, partial [Oscillospiraceae bacterium]|nr:single-stranded DNA-binding protein [Oscillospiraceae bacterium]
GGSYGDRGGYGSRPPAPSAPPADYGIPSGGDQFSELADDDGDLPF